VTFDRSPSSRPPFDSTRPGAGWGARGDLAEVSDPGISCVVLRPIARALEEQGLPSLLTELGACGSSRVAGSQADAFLDAAAAALNDEALGIHLAARVPVGALGSLDYAFCASADLRDALRRLGLYYSLMSERVGVQLVADESRTVIVFRRKPGLAQSRHWVELGLAMVVDRIRHALGARAVVEEVRFAHAAPQERTEHERFFGAPVTFSHSEDALVVKSGLGTLPFRTAAPTVAAVLDTELAAALAASADPPASGDPFLGRARRTIAAALDAGEAGVEHVASQLEVSLRTLQRELHRRGTSHSMIVDELRRERAIHLVAHERLTGTQVAMRLGFSEPGAFFRAFRRWTGTSPVAFRNARRAGQLSREP
jgi:AraC-like DNA-binding protein